MTIDSLLDRFNTEYPDIPYSVERVDWGYRFKLLNHKDFGFILTDEAFKDDCMDWVIDYFTSTPERQKREHDEWMARMGFVANVPSNHKDEG